MNKPDSAGRGETIPVQTGDNLLQGGDTFCVVPWVRWALSAGIAGHTPAGVTLSDNVTSSDCVTSAADVLFDLYPVWRVGVDKHDTG